MKVLIFGGTVEGKRLAGLLSESGEDVTLCVATEYGESVIPKNREYAVLAGRLSQTEISAILNKNKYTRVIDATHPYAEIATQNIKSACFDTNTEYVRLLRDGSNNGQSAIYAGNAEEAADFLRSTDGNVLLTTGSKFLEAFTVIDNYRDRLFARIIPMEDALEKAIRLGYKNSNIICMQGPFSVEMNAATLKMTGAQYMVTKDSGLEGGFLEKLAAAEMVGCKVIVISRPTIETGYTLHQIHRLFNISEKTASEPFTYFPLFMDLKGKKTTVIGGGKIAERRILALLNCNADITVISPLITDSLSDLAKKGAVRHINREYKQMDIPEAFLVIAATDDRTVNHTVMEDARASGILVNVSDNKSECDCFFPAIAENEDYIAGIVSKKGNHAELREIAKGLRRFLND